MKKFLAIFLCLMLAIGMCTMTGCDHYTQLTEAEADELYLLVEDGETGESVDFRDGYSLEFEMEMVFGDEEMSVSMELDFAARQKTLDGGEIWDYVIAAGSIKGEGDEFDMDVDVYYDGSFMYLNGKIDGQEMKGKQAMGSDEFANSYIANQADGIEVSGLLNYISYFVDFDCYKIYRDATNPDKIKIKVESNTSNDSDGYKMDSEACYVYDANYKLLSCEIEMTTTMDLGTFSTKTSIDMEVELFDGDIDFPNDLTSYPVADLT